MLSVKQPKKIRKKRTNHIASALLALLLFAVLIGCLNLLSKRPSEAQAKPLVQVAAADDMIALPAPVRNVAKGESLKDVEFTYVKWPKSQATAEYIKSIAEHKDSIATIPLSKFLPVPLSALSLTKLDTNAVVEGIPEGMRAITVKVDVESAVEGWARSGNYIDVIVIKNSPDQSLGLEAKVIAENIKILSAGRSTTPLDNAATAPQAPATVTLLVSQEDALKIKTAANVGRLTFALRGTTDQLPTISTSMDQKRLLGAAKTVETKAQAAYKGYAQGPDGKRYVLTDQSEWLRQSDETSNKRNSTDNDA